MAKDLQKEEAKRLRQEEKAKMAAMTKEEKEAYLAAKKAEKLAAFEESEKEYAAKVAERKANIASENGWNRFWFNFGQTGFCQWFRKGWNKFSHLHPGLAKLLYQIFFFMVFSNGVTIWQYLVMLFLPNLFGMGLAETPFVWPEITLWEWPEVGADGATHMIFGIFNEPVKMVDGQAVIGGGLGNFLAFEVAVFTAQCINFPLQRNITFKSDGNPVVQAIWYFIGWVAISILVNAVWGFVGPLCSHFIAEKAITDLLKTFITGGLSMFVFFFIFMIIFPEGEKKAEIAE